MKFGTFHLFSCPPWTNPYDVIAHEYEQMVHAERIGLDQIWLGEHNARRYGMVGNVVLTAGIAASMTSRIRIGTAVSRLPLHHPLHLAEDLAHVDIVSGGRLDWGLGKGYDSLEFSTYGVPFDEREERWQEAFEAVHSYWLSGSSKFDGKFHSGEEGEFFPMPLQRPVPPIYVIVSRSDSSIVWAAERLYPFVLGSGCDTQEARRKLALYRESAEQFGHPPEDVARAADNCWQLRQVHVSSTKERAAAEFEQSMLWYFETRQNRVMFGYPGEIQPYSYYLDKKFVLIGSSEQVATEMADYAEFTGIHNFVCWFNVGCQPQPQVVNTMTRFADEVIPMLGPAR
jgi:alkanesulfonate monooxygenase SsuD/methylene tetrahydromethanopterin reductase-like flavin-dependent oxidoreductase (luciferase family)